MKYNVVLVGGGGHCRSVINVIEEQGIYQIAGIVDVPDKLGSMVLGYKVFATDADLGRLAKEYDNFCITIGHVKSNALRKKLYLDLKKLGVTFPVIKSPHAYIAKSAKIGAGSVVMHRSVINSNAHIGESCIVNTGSNIEHDVIVGDHCHIGPMACVNGGCVIQDDCFVGSNAVLIPGIRIDKKSLIAAGSVIISNVPGNCIYAGNPGIFKKYYE